MKIVFRTKDGGLMQESIQDVAEARVFDDKGELLLEVREPPNFESGNPKPRYATRVHITDLARIETVTIDRVYEEEK